MLAGKRNVVTQKTSTGRGKVSKFPDIQQLIHRYGMITEWNESRGGRYSLTGRNDVHGIKVALLYPMNRPIPTDNREVRTELYLQAESIVEIMKKEHFQLINPPRIILGGVGGALGGQVEGTLEVEFTY